MGPLALTLGDPSGIGPEIALGAWAARRWDGDIPPFYVVGDLDLIAARARRDHMNAAIESCDPAEAARGVVAPRPEGDNTRCARGVSDPGPRGSWSE